VPSEGFYVKEKIPVTTAGIEPVTLRFVAQHNDHYDIIFYILVIYNEEFHVNIDGQVKQIYAPE
jgi:hypothetical protein